MTIAIHSPSRRLAPPAWAVMAFGLTLAVAHATEAPWMGEAALRTELTGKELAGIYPSGNHWRETIRADGTSDYLEQGRRKEGHWWLNGTEFCFTYGTAGSGGCFRVTRQSPNCYELFFVEEADARQDAPRTGSPSWNGMLWRTEAPTSCEQPAV